MKHIIAGLSLLVSANVVSSGAVLTLNMQSDAGDYIGQGHSFSLLYDTSKGSQIGVQIQDQSGGLPSMVFFLVGDAFGFPDYSTALLWFGTNRLGIPLQLGSFMGAERATFASEDAPGLDIAFQGRGCNRVGGSFTITEVTFNAANTAIQTFAATFEQHCETGVPALRGSVRYDLVPVPEPGAAVLGVAFAAGLLTRLKRMVPQRD